MNYLICQDFKSTHGNHAGMVHMCKLLKSSYPSIYKVMILPCRNYEEITGNSIFNKIRRKIYSLYHKYLVIYSERIFLAILLILKVKRNDRVFLLEYLYPPLTQKIIATLIKLFKPNTTIIGLAHLAPSNLSIYLTEAKIVKWLKYVDFVMTLGSSLTNFLNKCGVPKEKLITTFHYADYEYYRPMTPLTLHDPITIICMGNLQRNFELLSGITEKIKSVNWIICKGNKNIDYLFDNQNNVMLVPYVGEDKLKELMASADISLNVLDDTVGSNVITTSMAMGLIIVTSDVGSIRDYCDAEFSVFCENDISSFVTGISKLLIDKSNLILMKNRSLNKSLNFSIDKLHNFISQL